MECGKYKADIAGDVAAVKADCVATMRNEIANADIFVLAWEDCENALREYGELLTEAQLKACFKQAQRFERR